MGDKKQMQLIEGRDCHVAAEATLLRLLSCTAAADPEAVAFQTYAWQVMTLLDSHLCSRSLGGDGTNLYDYLMEVDRSVYDLLLLGGQAVSDLLDASLVPDLVQKASREQMPSLLLARQPAWPLRRVLLLIRGEATDAVTIEWGSYLSRLSQAHLTVLVVLPQSAGQQAGERSPMADVLTSESRMGQSVRRALSPLVSQTNNVILKLNQGDPASQVRKEIARGDYDLTILNAEPPGRLLHARLSNLIEPLLRWSPHPLLVANRLQRPDADDGEEAAWHD